MADNGACAYQIGDDVLTIICIYIIIPNPHIVFIYLRLIQPYQYCQLHIPMGNRALNSVIWAINLRIYGICTAECYANYIRYHAWRLKVKCDILHRANCLLSVNCLDELYIHLLRLHQCYVHLMLCIRNTPLTSFKVPSRKIMKFYKLNFV